MADHILGSMWLCIIISSLSFIVYLLFRSDLRKSVHALKSCSGKDVLKFGIRRMTFFIASFALAFAFFLPLIRSQIKQTYEDWDWMQFGACSHTLNYLFGWELADWGSQEAAAEFMKKYPHQLASISPEVLGVLLTVVLNVFLLVVANELFRLGWRWSKAPIREKHE